MLFESNIEPLLNTLEDSIRADKQIFQKIKKIKNNKTSMMVASKNAVDISFIQFKIKDIIHKKGLDQHIKVINSGPTLDITACNVDKINALHFLRGKLGINSLDKVVSFGDQGSIEENDYNLLSLPNGFSAKNTSNNIYSSFPVIDEEGDVLLRYEAVEHALGKIINQ